MLSRKRGPSPATLIAFVALLVALSGTTWAATRATTAAHGNLKGAKASVTVSNGGVAHGVAKCPSGYQVLSGGYAATSQQLKITSAAPARGVHGYIVDAVMPPVGVSPVVVRETATVSIVALCAQVGKPLVMSEGPS
jgi:hypothetical protein